MGAWNTGRFILLFRKSQTMKVALCLKGHMRTYATAMSYINNLRSFCDLDIFIHTWEDFGYLVLQNIPYDPKNPGTVNLSSGLVDKDHIINCYNPKKLVIERYDTKREEFEQLAEVFQEWYEQIKDDPTVGFPRMHSFMAQLYKENAVLNIKDEYANQHNIQYDVVITTRPDILMNINLSILKTISNSNSKIWVNRIELSQLATRGLTWVCNSFFAGNENSLSKMQSIYPDILKIYNELYTDWKDTKSTTTYGRMFCIHQLVQYHMTRMNLTPVVDNNISAKIIRK